MIASDRWSDNLIADFASLGSIRLDHHDRFIGRGSRFVPNP